MEPLWVDGCFSNNEGDGGINWTFGFNRPQLKRSQSCSWLCLEHWGFHIFFINPQFFSYFFHFFPLFSPHSSLARPLLPSREAGVWIMVTVLRCGPWWDCWCIILSATYCHLLAAVGRTNGYCVCTLPRDKPKVNRQSEESTKNSVTGGDGAAAHFT